MRKETYMADKRRLSRRDFSYYMQVTNARTKELLGYLSDISRGGFKLDWSCRGLKRELSTPRVQRMRLRKPRWARSCSRLGVATMQPEPALWKRRRQA